MYNVVCRCHSKLRPYGVVGKKGPYGTVCPAGKTQARLEGRAGGGGGRRRGKGEIPVGKRSRLDKYS